MKVIILAGGVDDRLFPLTRTRSPKYFLRIFDNISLLVHSITRYQPITKPEDIVIVTGSSYIGHVRNELRSCNMEKVNIVVEPEFRNTAPAIALALSYCKNELKAADDEVIFVSSADHLITPVNVFLRNIKKGLSQTGRGKIVLFGVKPNRPESDFSYIKVGEKLSEGFSVTAFHEKPSRQEAQEYITQDDYYWNWGIYVAQLDTFSREIERHSPEFSGFVQKDFQEALKDFTKLPKVSIKQAFAKTPENLALVLLQCFWNDVGTLDMLYDVLDRDEDDNAVKGEATTLDCTGSLFIGQKRLITGIGLKDFVVVETDDVLFVAPRGEISRIGELLGKMREDQRQEADVSTTAAYTQWGHFVVLAKEKNYCVIKLFIEPGAFAERAAEDRQWTVTQGCAAIEDGQGGKTLEKGQSLSGRADAFYKITNSGALPLEILEVFTGEKKP